MTRVYVSGALTDIPHPDELKGFYEAIGGLCREMGLDAYVPHLHFDPIRTPEVTPREVYETDKREVLGADLVIAYVGIPSLGVGMELAYADVRGIPIILLYEEGKRVSRFPRGIPGVIAEIEFRDYEHGLALLSESLRDFRKAD